MAKKDASQQKTVADDFTSELITSLNKDHGSKIAYNLSVDASPTHVKRWISTGCKQLDLIVSNKSNGGLPEGRIVEIFGPPSIGKSHIATQIARSTQSMGGIVVYIDTENGTSVENLSNLGVDVSKRFVYVDTHCTEEVLEIAEKTILKAKAMAKDVPITIIWDSVAASSPKAELEGAYDKDTIGLQARAISKGMRKITGVIGDQNVLFVILNQIRTKIGVMYGDPTTTPGGMAIPFHASVRIKLGAGAAINNKAGEPIGINVSAKIIKNKVAPPFRKVEFRIIFGKGIEEFEEVFDVLREYGPDSVNEHLVTIDGAGAWKNLKVTNELGEVLVEKKFYKHEFGAVWSNPLYKPWIDGLLDAALIKTSLSQADIDIDEESYEEIKSLKEQISSDESLSV
jgi:recombination protein RecA